MVDEELSEGEEREGIVFADDAVKVQTIQAAVVAALKNALMTLARYGCAGTYMLSALTSSTFGISVVIFIRCIPAFFSG